MAGFSAEWLALREPADHAARAADLLAPLLAALAPRTTGAGLAVLDLASGTGSNLRYLAARLPFRQHWTLVDHDETLLAHARRAAVPDGATVRAVSSDLAVLDGSLFAPPAGLPLLVTASALLDLASAAWLDTLADRCRAAGAAALFALTYDGRVTCAPRDPLDDRVRALVNQHQHTDKGFGAAAGPDAATVAVRAFEARRYTVHRAPSDWLLDAESAELQRQLVDGWAEAATETSPRDADAIAAWRTRRHDAIARCTSSLVVGHDDLVALP